MRYQIMKNGMIAQQASNVAMAEAIFTEACKVMQPGDTVTVYDKKDDRTIRTRHLKTAEEARRDADEELTHWATRQLSARESVEAFAAKVLTDLENDPTYSFRWADKSFEAAAAYDVALCIKAWREAGWSWADIAKHLRQEVMRNARHPERSTSVCSNFTAQCRAAAQAEALEKIERQLEHLTDTQ